MTLETASSPQAIGLSTRRVVRVSSETLAYAVVLASGIALRFWALGARALHHDESIHAQWSWDLLRGGYEHNPIFHGPLYYHAQALVFFLFGANDATARVSAALFGVALMAMPLALRRWLGPLGTFAATAFIALSPTLVYFSRFFREDIYLATFTLAMVVAAWRYLAGGSDRWLILFALATAAAHATKEATYLIVAIFLLYLNGALAADLARQATAVRPRSSTADRFVLTAALFPYAWAIAALWPASTRIRQWAGWSTFPRSGDVLVLLGTLTVPLLAPVLHEPLERALANPGQLQWPAVCQASGAMARQNVLILGGTYALLLGAAAWVGLAWRPRTWLWAAGLAAFLYLSLMTTLWTNLGGLCSGPWGSLDYWITQHDVRRGNQPWFYYTMLMPAYEFLVLSLALFGSWWAIARGDGFSRFLVFWIVGIWAALSWAGEKMPWLNVHIALPVALLAAWTVQASFDRTRAPKPGLASIGSLALVAGGTALVLVYLPFGGAAGVLARLLVAAVGAALALAATRPWLRSAVPVGVVAVLVGGLLPFSVRTMVGVTFERGDVPKDLLIYTQTSPAVPRLASDISKLATATGLGYDLPILVDTTDSFAWPWAWYLRDYRRVSYLDLSNGVPQGDYRVILAAERNVSKVTDTLGERVAEFAAPEKYPHRWWFPEDYKAALPGGPWSLDTWRRIGRGIFAGEWLPTWYRFWRDHEPNRDPGSVDAYAFFPSTFDRTTGLLTLRPSPPLPPAVDPEGRPTFGLNGTGPGQFLSPVDIAVDSDGNLYVVDRVTKKLQKFDAQGRFLASVDVRMTPGEASEPWGLAIAPNGDVVVADTFGWTIRVFDSTLRPLRTFGRAPSGAAPPALDELFGPRDIAFDSDGNLWVTDTGHDRIVVFSPDGTPIRAIGTSGSGPGQFDEPVGIAIAQDGTVYVADMFNARVQVLSADGRFLREFPVEGWGGTDALDKPYLTLLPGDRLALSLPSRNLVRIYHVDGRPLTELAPSLEPLSIPYGLVTGADGRLWVVEGGSRRVRGFDID